MSNASALANAEDYWKGRWDRGETSWKTAEQGKPFLLNISKFLSGLLNVEIDTKMDPTQVAEIAKERFAGARALVPLCGDSFVLRFLYELGCDVVGIDVAEVALRGAMNDHFGDCKFTESTLEVGSSSEVSRNGPTVSIFEGKNQEHDINPTITLIAGNVLAIPTYLEYHASQHSLKAPAPFDFVYDRGSMVAIDPTFRETYTAMLKSVLRPPSLGPSASTNLYNATPFTSAILLELMNRPAMCHDVGPPFHVDVDELAKVYYTTKEGFSVANIFDPALDQLDKLLAASSREEVLDGKVGDGRPFVPRYFAIAFTM